MTRIAGIVGDEERVARLVGRIEVHDHHQVGRGLGHGDADVAHVGRQPRLGDRHAVLHLHLGDVEVGAELERDGDGEAAVTRRVRRDVEHVLDAVDLLLERRDDGRGHHVGAGTGILARDVDHGGRDIGILGDRQAAEGDEPQDHEDEGHHPGEDRPVDEEAGDAHGAAEPQLAVVGLVLANVEASPLPATACGATLTPGRARIRPLTMTRSSAPARP